MFLSYYFQRKNMKWLNSGHNVRLVKSVDAISLSLGYEKKGFLPAVAQKRTELEYHNKTLVGRREDIHACSFTHEVTLVMLLTVKLFLLQIYHCSKVHIKINNIASQYNTSDFFCLLNQKEY